MSKFLNWLQSLALMLGAPGLFVIAFLDSSFLSLPEINDLLLVLMVTQHPARMPLYAACATLGSIFGCLILYVLGRKGGETFVRRRFSSNRVDRGIATFQRYGVMTILIPSLLPPPAPFKAFVLLAGVAGIDVWRFVLAIALGRGLRYFGEGVLAVMYGEQALEYIHENARPVGLAIVAVLLIGLLLSVLWHRHRPGKADRLT